MSAAGWNGKAPLALLFPVSPTPDHAAPRRPQAPPVAVYEPPETRHYCTEAQKKEGKKMAKQKQHVFSARTTEDGLRRLNELKTRLGVSWDDLVIDAVCAHYELDRAAMALPKIEKPMRESRRKQAANKSKKGKTGATSKKAKNIEQKG